MAWAVTWQKKKKAYTIEKNDEVRRNKKERSSSSSLAIKLHRIDQVLPCASRKDIDNKEERSREDEAETLTEDAQRHPNLRLASWAS